MRTSWGFLHSLNCVAYNFFISWFLSCWLSLLFCEGLPHLKCSLCFFPLTVSEFWLFSWGLSFWSWCLCRWKIKISVLSSDCRHKVSFLWCVCWHICQKLSGLSVSLSLGPLFYPTAAHVCLCASAMLLLLLWLGSITSGRGSLWYHSFCSGLLWVSGVFHASIWI